MKTKYLHIMLATVCLAAGAVQAEQQTVNLRFEPVFTNLNFERPVYLTHSHDGSDRIFVVEQRGLILSFENRPDVDKADVAIDLRRPVLSPDEDEGGNEEGLLGFAFHPNFSENRQVFINYTARRPRGNVLARFIMDENYKIDPSSEQVILRVPQPFENHNGGMIEFGPDGYLYMALGDGGDANDPHKNGQDLSTLFATILRIDVDHKDPGKEYAIPKDNPFVSTPEARGEIWAYGLRNVWRFSFDRKTGDLWAGDVGQDIWEEYDLVVKGGNYGWNYREGSHEFEEPESGMPDNLIDPVVEYSHELGQSSTGGYVYRGKKIPALVGAYVYGDYQSGLIWYLRYENGKVTDGPVSIAVIPEVSSFGEDRDGELYVVSLRGGIFAVKPATD